jgi:O-antigen/teichoic acid export membrane protein
MGPLTEGSSATPAPDARLEGTSRAPDGGGRDDLKTLARGGALNLVGTITYGILNFLLVVIVTQGVGKDLAGVFFEAVALFVIASNAAELGADTGLVRMIARYRTLDRAHDIRWTLRVALGPVAAAGTILAVAGWVFAGPLSSIFDEGTAGDSLVPSIHLLALFLPLSAIYTVATAGTRGFGTMVPSVVIDKIGKPLGQNLLALGAVLAGLGSVALAAAYGIPIGLGFFAAVTWLFVLERRSIRVLEETVGDPGRAHTPPRQLFSEFWRFTAPRGLAGVFQVAILWLDTLLIGALRSSGEAAVYTASSRYIVAGQAILAATTQAIAPQIASLLAAKVHDRAEGLYQAATAWLTTFTWPIYLTMAVFSPVLVRIFGSGFAEGSTVLTILASTMLVSMACGPVDVVLLMGGRSWWSAFNTMIALVVNVVLNLLLIPRYGINGAAIAWSLSILLRNLLPLYQVSRFLGLKAFGPGFRVAALGSVGIYVTVLLVGRWVLGESLVAMLLSGAVATAAYAVFVWRKRRVLQLDLLKESVRRRPRGGEPAEAAAKAMGE